MGKGKTYLVSGSSRGVGLALVKELLSKPDERIVFAAARSPQKSEELQKLAKEHQDRLHIITFDVTDGDSAKVSLSSFDGRYHYLLCQFLRSKSPCAQSQSVLL